MGALIPRQPSEETGIVVKTLKGVALTLAHTQAGRWLASILDYLANVVESWHVKRKYVSRVKTEFHALMNGFALGDEDRRAWRQFCLRVHASLDREGRTAFMSAVASILQIDRIAITFFAAKEQEYLALYFGQF